MRLSIYFVGLILSSMAECSYPNSYTISSMDGKVSVTYELSNKYTLKDEAIAYSIYGNPNGVEITTMTVHWKHENRTVCIPKINLSGLMDTIQESNHINPIGISVFPQSSGIVIIKNYFYKTTDSIACYWLVWPSGKVEFVPLPQAGILRTPYIRGKI